jgi:hypothetical protein
MPLTPKERELVELMEGGHNRREFPFGPIRTKLVKALRRMDAESRRQRRSIARLKRKLRLWTGE